MKIEEMADEYIYSTLVSSLSGERNAYIAGAKAVLNEIEKAYDTYEDFEATCTMVRKAIQKLKRELNYEKRV